MKKGNATLSRHKASDTEFSGFKGGVKAKPEIVA